MTEVRMTHSVGLAGLALRTLGTWSLSGQTDDGSEHILLRRGKALGVLTFLRHAGDAGVTRAALVDMLWAESDQARGKLSLRQALHQLRQLLGEDAFASGNDVVVLKADMDLDSDRFFDAIARGDVESAVQLYVGPFIPDFAQPGAAEFEAWADLERQRLKQAYMRALHTLATQRLGEGRHREAYKLADTLRRLDPLREASWRLLFESMVHSRDSLQLHVEIDALLHLLNSEGRKPEPATLDLVRRLKAEVPTGRSSPLSFATDLVAREAEFAAILGAWRDVRRGSSRRVLIEGPAGVGKTRLAQEALKRFEISGIRTCRVRAQAGERQLPLAVAAELANALCELPGALGIAPDTAATLLTLSPRLSNVYTGSRDRSDGAELIRRAGLALVELLCAISEETPLVVYIDDLHWSDPESEQVLRFVLARVPEGMMIIISARQVERAVAALTDVSISLAPLDTEGVGELLLSAGEIEDDLLEPLASVLYGASFGLPNLLLQSIQLALEAKWLERSDNVWQCPSLDQLRRCLPKGEALRQRIGRLNARDRRILLQLAVAGVAMSDSIIDNAEAIGDDGALASLEIGGLVRRSGKGWEIAHDQIVDAVIGMASGDELSRARLALADSMEAANDVSWSPIAARLRLVDNPTADVSAAFRRWLGTTRRDWPEESVPGLAARFLQLPPGSPAVRALVHALPISLRWSRDHWSASAAGIAFLMLFLAGFVLNASRPDHLRIAVTPIGLEPLTPAPVIEIVDRRGRRVSASDTVTAVIESGVGHFIGRSQVVAVNGRAIFRELSITDNAPHVLRFEARGMQPVRTDTLRGEAASYLRIQSALLNGQRIEGQSARIAISAGDIIKGEVDLEYTSGWASAAVMLGVTPTWGDRENSFVVLGGLITPVANQPKRVRIEVPGPDRAGIHHLIFAFQAETPTEFIFSGTNWTVGRPIWHDGNDVVDWNAKQLAAARYSGQVQSRVIREPRRWTNYMVPAAVIDVHVR